MKNESPALFLTKNSAPASCEPIEQESRVQIDRSIYIAASAKIQIDPDRCILGGFVRVSKGVTISDGVIIAPYGGSIEIGAHALHRPVAV